MFQNNFNKKEWSPKELELYSSAFTLSDMEIFIFPHLLYSLVLANLMSPIVWQWKEDPWFKDLEKKNFSQKINRIKQFIMNRFVFNLDLESWGLTTQEKELERFAPFLSPQDIAQSNALFGYEGDKYYFDIDIRRHFGLDKYQSNIIPYWKTETIEAMEAFQFKPDYPTGAGECVSLSTLYAAALFILAQVPLEEMFLIGTPLHSQNFIIGADKEGFLTNNRRIVTKAMWFNGTALSAKARRALEKEQVSIVSHITGNIHSLYPDATIDSKAYQKFEKTLIHFLQSPLDARILSHFLRSMPLFQSCFQFEFKENNKSFFVGLEIIYNYEKTSSNNFSTPARNALLKELDKEEFSLSPLKDRILLNDVENLMQNKKLSLEDFENYTQTLPCFKTCPRVQEMIEGFKNFVKTTPKLPVLTKKQQKTLPSLNIKVGMNQEQIKEILQKARLENPVADLAFYAFRDMENISWQPFFKAAFERNPVSLLGLKNQTPKQAYQTLKEFKEESIYPKKRLAQPDEVWNFKRGDGAEKAILLAGYLKFLKPKIPIQLKIMPNHASILWQEKSFDFSSLKELNYQGNF